LPLLGLSLCLLVSGFFFFPFPLFLLFSGRAGPPPVPSKSPSLARKSAAPVAGAAPAADEAPRSPRVTRVAEPKPATSWGGTSENRYEPLIGADTESNSGCPNCGTPHRPGAKFCDGCGFNLVRQSSGSVSSNDWAFNPGRYVPLTSLRIAEAVMVGLGLLIFLLLCVQRFFYKELFAFIYAILVFGGAICAMMVVVSHNTQPGSFFVVYFFAWAMASIVKMFWLCCADFGPSSLFKLEQHPLLDSKIKLFILAGFMVMINTIGFSIQLYILTSTFEERE
jgi:hypothetical protein